MNKKFETGKTSENIDKNKKFVCVLNMISKGCIKGDILEYCGSRFINHTYGYFKNMRTGECMLEISWENLAYLEDIKTWENLEVGDVLTDKEALNKKKVLGVCGEIIFLGRNNNIENNDYYITATKKQLQIEGWKIKDITEDVIKETPGHTMKELIQMIGFNFKIKK